MGDKTQWDFVKKFTTPKVRAVFPKLIEADTKFDSQGVWQAKLAFTQEQADAFAVKANEVLDAYIEAARTGELKGWTGAKVKKFFNKEGEPKTVADLFTEEVDQDEEETGFLLLNVKRKSYRTDKEGKVRDNTPIKFFDSHGKEFTPEALWGGSELLVGGEFVPYAMDSTKTIGLSLRINGAQVIKLNAGSDSTAADFGFGDEEGGYEANPAPDVAGVDTEDDDPDF